MTSDLLYIDLYMDAFQQLCQKVLTIIASFPTSYNGIPYLSLGDGRKCYFDVFIKKYGIDGSTCKYHNKDVARRIRLVEFFDSFLKSSSNTIYIQEGGNTIIDSTFYRMVLGTRENHKGKRLVLISFYHHT